ncbi:MAG: hypothetical protein CME64_17115 [Halobacteriovoraceae bacterium]|nr:hypothetical protein [Halobacteriovoraceae bacterium]|tara:strand:+ start:247525 stop:248298 length:774 start_codon:yes stop_codon:yes gene_type:complete
MDKFLKALYVPKNLFESSFLLGLLICFFFNFLVTLASTITGVEIGIPIQLDVFLILGFDLATLASYRFSKKMFLFMAFVSTSCKMTFDLFYGDAGHIFFQKFLFLGLLISFMSSEEKKRTLRVGAVLLLLLSYFFTGFQKLFSDDFVTGNAVLKVFGSPVWSFVGHNTVVKVAEAAPAILTLAGVAVLLIELILPWLFIMLPRTRKLSLFTFLIFHAVTFIFLELTTFPIFMIILDLCVLGPVVYYNGERNLKKELM